MALARDECPTHITSQHGGLAPWSTHQHPRGTHRLAALAKHRAPKGGLTLGLSEGISFISEVLPSPPGL